MNKKIAFLFLLLFSFLSFGLTFKAGFIWHDHQMIVENPYIKDFNMSNLIHNLFSNAFNREDADAYYRPLQLISYMFDFHFFKLNPLGWHLINFLIHFFNSFFLYLLLKRLDFSEEISFLSSLFLAVNPVVVEQLIIVAGRAELMTLFFSLLSILFYLKGGRLNFLFSLVFYFLSMLSKESGIITPFFIVLCLWFRKQQYHKNLIIYFLLIPFYLALRKAAVNAPVVNINYIAFAINLILKMPLIFLNYIQKTLFPFNLYSHNTISFNIYLYILAVLFIALIIYGAFKTKNRVYIFSLLWYFIALIPKLPLFGAHNDLVLDHLIYPSNIGLFIFLSYFLNLLKEKNIKTYSFALITIISIWISFSIDNISKRDSDIKIYEHAIQYPTSAHVYYSLAREYYLRGNYIKARQMLEKVINDYNQDEMFLNAYAMVINKTGEYSKAVEILQQVIEKGAKMPATFTNIAAFMVEKKEYDMALKYLFIGLKTFPEDENIKLYIARIFSIKGKREKAKEFLKAILDFNPYNPEALLNMGIMEFESKNFAKSKEYLKKLIEVSPSHPVALNYLSKIPN